ncbi:putative MET16-3`-phosphoadenylylsulfate reductase [Jaminaea rosea]|uniref:Putative MET16-3`-phosphoadenylylsulfate reductase n=1 Tax=Jaminaea rosea TaxID=1569628 RepID=A0A316UIK3_9BASI|nr:putative MET16-3`-phosphoadenylylsulfate reductase [Jaminaea rosea]PWN25157.1 putative MET16-3`-phosphoadenylylsulfate reductase [Jaminaea rosea]
MVTSPTASSSQRAIDDARIASVISNLDSINQHLESSDPFQILEWAIDNLPGLYQTTAFGVTGCVSLDQIARISETRARSKGEPNKHLVDLIWCDTLYGFPQTVDLAYRAAKHYDAKMHIYRPEGCDTVGEFESKWGSQLWERDEDTYDYIVKVEPARRAYQELGVRAVFTGRRRSQGDDRSNLKAIEVDETGLVKVNPFLNWSFAQVDEYVKQNAVPYNELLDMGYKSIGDWHSTAMPGSDGGERSGRWKDKGGKTECGLHTDYFKMKRIAEKKVSKPRAASRQPCPRSLTSSFPSSPRS